MAAHGVTRRTDQTHADSLAFPILSNGKTFLAEAIAGKNADLEPHAHLRCRKPAQRDRRAAVVDVDSGNDVADSHALSLIRRIGSAFVQRAPSGQARRARQ